MFHRLLNVTVVSKFVLLFGSGMLFTCPINLMMQDADCKDSTQFHTHFNWTLVDASVSLYLASDFNICGCYLVRFSLFSMFCQSNLYVFTFVWHWRIHDEKSTKNQIENWISPDLVTFIGSACLLIVYIPKISPLSVEYLMKIWRRWSIFYFSFKNMYLYHVCSLILTLLHTHQILEFG